MLRSKYGGDAKVAVQPTQTAVYDSVKKMISRLSKNWTDSVRDTAYGEISMLQGQPGVDAEELVALTLQIEHLEKEWSKKSKALARPISQVLAGEQLLREGKGMAKRARTSYVRSVSTSPGAPRPPAPWEQVRGAGGGPPINPEDL